MAKCKNIKKKYKIVNQMTYLRQIPNTRHLKDISEEIQNKMVKT